jgi:RNAse (barnase) inhibitor barstar
MMRKIKLRPTIANLIALPSNNANAVIEVAPALITHARFANELAYAGLHAMVIDRAPVFDKTTLLHALYQSCQFPAYFGFNWDALLDCLSDFGWHAAKGYALIVRNAEVIKNRNPDDWVTFLEVVRAAAQRRADAGAAPLYMYVPALVK